MNPRLGHSANVFAILPTFCRGSADPAHGGKDRLAIEEECRGSVMRPNLGHQAAGWKVRRVPEPSGANSQVAVIPAIESGSTFRTSRLCMKDPLCSVLHVESSGSQRDYSVVFSLTRQ